MAQADGEAQPAAARSRRERSASESLLSIVLGLEAFVVFFIALTVYGLKSVPPAVAFGGGAALIVVFLAAAYLVRYPWGVWLGWLLQLALIALGFLTPVLFAVGAIFVAIWVYCFITGRRLDARKRAFHEHDNDPQTL